MEAEKKWERNYLFRGDKSYRSAISWTVPYNAQRDAVQRAQAASDHVRDKLNGRESEFRSFTTDLKTARDKFADGGTVIKVRMEALKALEAAGTIRTLMPSDVYDLIRNSGDAKLARSASEVRAAMIRNYPRFSSRESSHHSSYAESKIGVEMDVKFTIASAGNTTNPSLYILHRRDSR